MEAYRMKEHKARKLLRKSGVDVLMIERYNPDYFRVLKKRRI
jgi:predicted Fe-Mo cluster-binding NifX family protein